MTIGAICTRKVISVDREIDIPVAARVMRDNHIGYLIVTDARSGGSAPIGVITDRDIVVKVVAKDVDPHTLTVGDVMTPSRSPPRTMTASARRCAGCASWAFAACRSSGRADG